MIVIDASLTMAWLLAEPTLAPSLGFDDLFEREALVVPPHWQAEVGNAFITALRRGRIPRDRMEMLVQRLAALDIQIEPTVGIEQIIPLTEFAATHNLTYYDAAYVQIALDRSIALGTLDNDMRASARRLNIPLLPAAAP